MSGDAPLVAAALAGGVARLALNRPEKRNALSGAMVRALAAALAEAERDPAVRVVAITGEGSDFCSGADLEEVSRQAEGPVTESLEAVDELGSLLVQIRRLHKPVVALVRGRALAGGCGLATACDLVLAERGASFGYPEVRIGFVPAMVMAILRRNLTEKRAFELVALGETIGAAEAERVGLVNRVLEDTDFEAGSERFLAELARRSPSALQLIKRLLYEQDGMTFEAGVRAGAAVNVVARLTDDARDGFTRFLSRRSAGEQP